MVNFLARISACALLVLFSATLGAEVVKGGGGGKSLQGVGYDQTAGDPLKDFSQTLKGLGGGFVEDELLPAEEAFRFSAEIVNSETLRVEWQIADGYYLYREKFRFSLIDASSVTLGRIEIPHGKTKQDEAFGSVEVFYHRVSFDLPLVRSTTEPVPLLLKAHFQGCAERGVCYPPMDETVAFDLPALQTPTAPSATQATAPDPPATPQSDQDRIAAELKHDSLWLTVLSFLGFGLLLAFTPCCFPMIPILSGIIVGQGTKITTGKAFVLSLSYVLASAVTYTVFGVLAGLFGGNLQAVFQEPWIIVAFSMIFVVLALSMFGFYELQVPVSLQSRISALSAKQHGGTVAGAAIMGLLSALIVGPCVAAPLAGALIYIGQTGDGVLGGLALFAMGLGMGIPLLILGTSAGGLLPKAGAWMSATKAVFGVMMLAVAIWMLERIVPAAVTMTLWAVLSIVCAIYLGAADSLPDRSSGWRRLWKGVGVVMLTYGVLLLIGVASGSRDVLQPLYNLAGTDARQGPKTMVFQRVGSVADLEQRLEQAQQSDQWVMLDFYADWCISCKEMERYTFSHPDVQSATADMLILQADVTDNSLANRALLKQFNLVGPPATLFFGPDQKEREAFRLVGYVEADAFLSHIDKVIQTASVVR